MIKIHVKNEHEAQAMANFLRNEQFRHQKDILDIQKDIDDLINRWGVFPTIKKIIWYEVCKKTISEDELKELMGVEETSELVCNNPNCQSTNIHQEASRRPLGTNRIITTNICDECGCAWNTTTEIEDGEGRNG